MCAGAGAEVRVADMCVGTSGMECVAYAVHRELPGEVWIEGSGGGHFEYAEVSPVLDLGETLVHASERKRNTFNVLRTFT